MSAAVAESLTNNAPPAGALADAANNNAAAAALSDDAALEAIWNKNERDNGAARDEGKFSSPNPEKKTAAQTGVSMASPEGGGGEGQAGDSLTPGAEQVPLPANWQGIKGGVADNVKQAWEKAPAELRKFVSDREQELQGRLSDHGRTISAYKPIQDVIERNGKYFDPNTGKKGADGRVITPAQAIDYLFNVQQSMDQAPVETVMNIIDRYGIRDKVAAVFGQTVQQGENELRQEIAGLKQMLASVHNSANIDDRINQRLQERDGIAAANEELSRLSADKPLYSEIPEKRMVAFINDAWDRLGSTASKEAVFNLAYDMAVNADPDLRAKAAAAKPAAPKDTGKVDAAKRANSVNIPSTASGKARVLTEDEELAAVYDRNHKG
ncbi:MAG: hypothetical protein EOQ55_00680 [Mesorhizobium sp.]|uniref:hypothetical protein n=1 Tax=Mesorhizobium sp. TaxID=1871066 RepID=UPI000FE45E72|nr:hypothetical protein [Mesorhizobium sp.]RWG23305.1 MAG: hypothetical protein EOQ55_00680 [Mesorhizobium sp.]RWG60497.1 MAG: hypothetical protein EOQ64_01595 [Mesorhizobium sp.]RWH42127.1 MAG: hypothetical protein EOQ78_17815 [Mesorhizobium sp.]